MPLTSADANMIVVIIVAVPLLIGDPANLEMIFVIGFHKRNMFYSVDLKMNELME